MMAKILAKFFLFVLGTWVGGFSVLSSRAGGEEVVVIYNSKMPESKSVAYFYARHRDVPPQQVLGFDLPTSEDITRGDFRNDLQQPLAKKIEALKLWRLGKGELPGTNGTRLKVTRKVVDSKIRYAVLCYGVPLRIKPDNGLQEAGDANLRPELRRNGAAADSELACFPQLAAGYPLAGPNLNPLYGTTNAALLHPTNGILLVTRLDGPTAEIARSLVEKSLQAEADGLWGHAYFDVRNVADPGYKIGDDWIRAAAQLSQQLGFETFLDEKSDTFTASFPMSQIAIYMGWYRENISGPFTLPQVEFRPGAFAYHLHSFSASSLRATNHSWAGPLLAKGATCTMGSVDEPYLTGTPDLGTFAGRWLYYGFTFGEAAYAAQTTLSWQTAVVGDPLYRPFGKNVAEQHRALLQQTNRLAEWSTLRIGNLSRNQGLSTLDYATALETTPLTKTSAVLTEKLADLYTAQGKPASAILACERALALDPSPQQRLRLRLTLGEKLLAAKRTDEARKNYEQLFAENPDYPETEIIRRKIPSKSSAAN
jgi:uncharacterized protein (TIGR03790 family)